MPGSGGRGDTDDQTRGGYDAVIGSQNGCSQPGAAITSVSLIVSMFHVITVASFIAGAMRLWVQLSNDLQTAEDLDLDQV